MADEMGSCDPGMVHQGMDDAGEEGDVAGPHIEAGEAGGILESLLDRLASRQLLDQEQFETKLDQITRRQTLLESRSSALATLPDTTPTGSIKPASRAGAPAIIAPQTTPKPSPINDTGPGS